MVSVNDIAVHFYEPDRIHLMETGRDLRLPCCTGRIIVIQQKKKFSNRWIKKEPCIFQCYICKQVAVGYFRGGRTVMYYNYKPWLQQCPQRHIRQHFTTAMHDACFKHKNLCKRTYMSLGNGQQATISDPGVIIGCDYTCSCSRCSALLAYRTDTENNSPATTREAIPSNHL